MIRMIEHFLNGVDHGVELVNSWIWVASGLVLDSKGSNFTYLVISLLAWSMNSTGKIYHGFFDIITQIPLLPKCKHKVKITKE